MKNIPTATEAAKMSDEYQDETVYELSPESEKLLSDAIQRAISHNARKVDMTVRAYGIEEGSHYVTKFLESKGYKEVVVQESGYTCFDNDRGHTNISFNF